MIIHLVNIHIPYVFKRYVRKYNIYRDLHEIDILGLEIRNLDKELAEKTRHIIFRNKEICYYKDTETENCVDLLILGSYGIFKELAKDIGAAGNEDLGHKITRTLNQFDSKTTNLDIIPSIKRSAIAGIVNVTPDSFSDGGNYVEKSKAVEQALKLLEEGADIIDIGGESTRPGADKVSEEEEIKRVIPVIEEILKHKKDTLISIDTMKSAVASEAVKAGASIINDVSSFNYDKKMLDTAAELKVPVILMHMKGNPKTMQDNPFYDDPVLEIYDYLADKIKTAHSHGLEKVIIDPGIGFGKRVSDNYEILERLIEFKGLSKPVLIGVSRKSMFGKALNLKVDEREDATLAAETLAIKNGASLIRTHNVKNTLRAAKVCSFLENPEMLNNV